MSMKIRSGGFTLIELMVVVAVVGTLSVAGVGLFYRALRGTSKTESYKELEQNVVLVMNILERHIRNSRTVLAVGGGECPATGATLSILGFDGGTTLFGLTAEGAVASNGSEISASSISILDLEFICTRQAGAPDQITINLTAEFMSGGELSTERSYTSIVGLRNY